MGFIRGGLVFFIGILLLISLIVGNIFLTLSMSLNYENVKPELVSVVDGVLQDKDSLGKIDGDFEAAELYCQDNPEYVFSDDGSGRTFVIPCEIIFQGKDAVIEYAVNDLVEKEYYKKYDCALFDCSSENGLPFHFVSQHAKNYWNGKFWITVLVSLVLIAGMFFLFENKINLLIVVGALLVISSLPFMRLSWFFGLFEFGFIEFFSVFLSKSHTVFLITLVLGVVLLGVGVGLKFWKFGEKISESVSESGRK